MRILLLVIFLLVVNCKFNKIVDSHGSHYLEKKQKELTVNLSNKNDIIYLLGPPSTKSKFDNDLWIYIESKKTRTTLLKLGKKKIYINNVFECSYFSIYVCNITLLFIHIYIYIYIVYNFIYMKSTHLKSSHSQHNRMSSSV